MSITLADRYQTTTRELLSRNTNGVGVQKCDMGYKPYNLVPKHTRGGREVKKKKGGRGKRRERRDRKVGNRGMKGEEKK